MANCVGPALRGAAQHEAAWRAAHNRGAFGGDNLPKERTGDREDCEQRNRRLRPDTRSLALAITSFVMRKAVSADYFIVYRPSRERDLGVGS